MNAAFCRHILTTVLMVLGIAQGFSSSIHAKLDSAYIEMGRVTILHLEVTSPVTSKGELIYLKHLGQNGIYPVCGDSVELRAPLRTDSTVQGRMLTLGYSIPVQAFDSGLYRLPSLLYLDGKDTLRSNELTLKVVPVKASAEDPIADYAGVSDPAGWSIFDYVPDWVLDFWWLIILILAAIVLFVWGLLRYRKQGSLLPPKPEPTPYEKAVRSLKELKAGNLWEKGLEKEYYTRLTEILRQYLAGRFGINAMEMTSRQILQHLRSNESISSQSPKVRQILDMADFVKFAKVRPLPADNVKALENAVAFVEETKPVEAEETNPVEAEETNPETEKKKGGRS